MLADAEPAIVGERLRARTPSHQLVMPHSTSFTSPFGSGLRRRSNSLNGALVPCTSHSYTGSRSTRTSVPMQLGLATSEAKDEACLRSGTPLVPHLCTEEPSIAGTPHIDQPSGCASGGHAIHGRPPDDDSGCNGQTQSRTVVFGTFSCSEGMPAVSTVSPGVATRDTAAASMSVVAPAPETSAVGKQEQGSLVDMLHVDGYQKDAEQDNMHSTADTLTDTA